MKRDAMKKLISWKDNPTRKPLIIRGARQVGQTWLAKEFGKTMYEKMAYVNFEDSKALQVLLISKELSLLCRLKRGFRLRQKTH